MDRGDLSFEGCHTTGFAFLLQWHLSTFNSFLPSNRKYPSFLETTMCLSRHPSDLTLVKTRTSSPSREKSVGFGKRDTGSCVKRSHMEYEWQPSVNTRSFFSHGQYHHPVMYTRLHAPNSENKVRFCCLASSVAKQMQGNIPRVLLDPTQSHLSFICFMLWDLDRRPRRGPSCCLVCHSLKAICCLLTVAYRIAEWAKEHVCASGSPSTSLVTSVMMS